MPTAIEPNVTENPGEGLPGPEKQETLEQCARILGSAELRNALSLQRLLRFLVMETLEGRGSGLKEYSVGLEVFQRTQDFDPRTDAIVRVTVGQLRRRLSAYYSSDGSGDRVVIQIPKGRYAAEFTYAEPASAMIAGSTAESESAGLRIGGTAWWTTGRLWALCLALMVVVVMVSLGWWIHLRREDAGRAEALHTSNLRQSFFWSTFLHGDTRAIAVVGIASSVSIGSVIVRVPNLNDPQTMQNNETIQKLSSVLGQPAYPYNVYTGIGEALGAARLERAFTESSLDLSMLASREVRWQDLHAENVIFISSLHFRDLRSALGRSSDFVAEDDGEGRLRIANHSPRNGEQAIYKPTGNYVVPSVDYALVSIVPGTVANRSILTVGGTGTLGTGGAVQFLTERASLAELDAKLRRDVPSGGHNGLQILLKVDIVDNQVVSVHYVTHHWMNS